MPGIEWEELVSVVVPVYNCEKYITKCIESILNQSYKKLEIILVDDGSTDDSGKLCDQYAAKDSRIRVSHGSNCGAAAARKRGVKNASADYIAFIDSDDYVECDYIETLMTAIIKEQADVVCSDYINEGWRGKTVQIMRQEIFCHVEEMLEAFFRGMECMLVMNGKIFRKKLLTQLRFENLKYGEDSFTLLDCFTKCKKMVLIPYSGYHYVMNPESVTNRNDEYFRWQDWMRRVEFLKKICSAPNLEKRFSKPANRMYAQYLFASLCVNCKYASKEDFLGFSRTYPGYYAKIRARDVGDARKAFVMWVFSWNSMAAREIVRLHEAYKCAMKQKTVREGFRKWIRE